jgi:hypothetical protein
MHTRYVLTNKCFREGANSEGCLGEPHHPPFRTKNWKKNVVFNIIIKHIVYYPMTNDPGSIEVQYSIVLLFE